MPDHQSKSHAFNEPWRLDEDGWIRGASGAFAVEYKGCGSHGADWAPGARERAIACVNALEGFDPEDARAALWALARREK